MSAPALTEAGPTPAAELRTSLALAALAAALVHVMSAVHGGALVTSVPAAAILVGLAATLAFTRSRTVLGPVIAFNLVLSFGGVWFAIPAQLVVAGGALALLWGATDRTLARWSKLAFAIFAISAITGFGHLGH